MRQYFLLILIAGLLTTEVQAQGETPQALRNVVDDCKDCPQVELPPDVRNMTVTNFSIAKDAEGYVVAFKSSLEAGGGTPFYVLSISNGEWQVAEFPTKGKGDGGKDLNGPVMTVQRNEGMILVGISVSFSDVVTAIVTPELKLAGLIHGSVTAILPNDLVIYQRNQDRFARTHYSELVALDTTNGNERDIYPPATPDRIRLDRIEHDRADYAAKGQQWCQDNKHHCDPTLFDNHMWKAPQGRSYAYDASKSALAFSQVYGSGEDEVDVLVVCTDMDELEDIACHESPLGADNGNRSDILTRAAADPSRVGR